MQGVAELGSPMLPRPFRVLEKREEIPGCVSLQVAPDGDGNNILFAPGQFYMVYVFGHGEVPISVSGDPAKPGQLTFTVMAVGSVTRALCACETGDTLGLRGPFGSAWPVDKVKGRDVIIMAGGLGLAPLRPAIYQLLRERCDYGDLALLYGTRQARNVVFAQELSDWHENTALDVELTVDTAGRDWRGRVGVVTELLKGRSIDPATTSALICGPEIMMRFSAQALLDLGVAADDIYLSMERNMKCAIKMCGRCQYGPYFICNDGPVFCFARVERLLKTREV